MNTEWSWTATKAESRFIFNIKTALALNMLVEMFRPRFFSSFFLKKKAPNSDLIWFKRRQVGNLIENSQHEINYILTDGFPLIQRISLLII